MVQDRPKLAQKGPKIDSRWGKLGQDAPRLLKTCTNKAPESPKIAQTNFKMVPRWAAMAQDGPICLSRAVLGFHLGPSQALPGFAFALPSLCLCFAIALPLLCLCFDFAFRMGGAPLAKYILVCFLMGDHMQINIQHRKIKRKYWP